MNYITGHGFFSAYPQLTDNGCNLISHLAFYPRPSPPPAIIRSLLKYADRGIRTYSSPSQWEYDEINPTLHSLPRSLLHPSQRHVCGLSPICPHTVRTNFDRGCLFVPFCTGNVGNNISLRTLDPLTVRAGATVWNLGGVECEGYPATVQPFVLSNGAWSVKLPLSRCTTELRHSSNSDALTNFLPILPEDGDAGFTYEQVSMYM